MNQTVNASSNWNIMNISNSNLRTSFLSLNKFAESTKKESWRFFLILLDKVSKATTPKVSQTIFNDD